MIYKAAKEDIPVIVHMAMELWENHTIKELTEEFEDIINDDEAAVFLIEINNQPAGFAQCQLRHDYVEGTGSSPVGYLEGIFIKQGYRKQGLAGKLLEKCEEWAREQGCIEFASDCELDNTISLTFHLAKGFTESNRIICFTKHL